MPSYSLDVSAANFQSEVIAASHRVPVIADFWAPWCGPCRILKPLLEKLADEYEGKFMLAKINADENQDLARQFGVRGIPAVKAFVNGELVDEFSGALPEPAVREFIDRLLPSPGDELRAKAMESYRGGEARQALEMLAEAAQIDPRNERIRIDAAEIMIELGETDEAGRLLDSLHPANENEARVMELQARLLFAQKSQGLPDAATLEYRIGLNENDLEARLQLAHHLAARRQYEPAMAQLLEIIRRDRSYGDDIGRKTMLSLFSLISGKKDLVGKYRRLMASALN